MTDELAMVHVTSVLGATAALGTAAFGLVDASKAFWGGVSRAGFGSVRIAVTPFIGGAMPPGEAMEALGRDDILAMLFANWINGLDKGEQKARAKAIIRMCLVSARAPTLAAAVGVDPAGLIQVTHKIESGAPLSTTDLNLLGRFDAIVSAKLDEGYERADQQYRNAAKLCAGVIAMILAAVGGAVAAGDSSYYWTSSRLLLSLLVGAVSIPIAPMAKDVSSALVAAVNAVGVLRK